MGSSNQLQHKQESKRTPQLRCYPVSARAYNKKDFDYLSTFPRVAMRASTPRHKDGEHSQVRSDVDSDLFMTSSSVDYATSLSSASSNTSSVQSYGVSSTDMENGLQHQGHLHKDHHHPLQQNETSTPPPPQNSMENSDLQKLNYEKSLCCESNFESKDDKSDSPSPAEDDGSVEVQEASIRLRPKGRPRHIDTPAVLPKFGSWNTKNPSSGEAYTLIFKRLRDEKQSPAVFCGSSPTPSKAEEEANQPLRLESKAKEDSLRRERKPTSQHLQEAAQQRGSSRGGSYAVRSPFWTTNTLGSFVKNLKLNDIHLPSWSP